MDQEIISLLTRKLDILDQIADNTERQGRFIKKQQMTGLRRLLRERETLIKELGDIVEILREKSIPAGDCEVHSLQKNIKGRHAEILAACRQVLQSAQSLKGEIFSQLHSTRTSYRLNSQYIYQWERPVSRARINAKV
ncbi:flagellar export chaperone FlgN [Propionispora hippei]|uniref:FlgN protein n=1 Tax=Propionispora hippei DSM 15287 TaxID=1123003 RepID=A0A1M6C1I0_9FIRM|nr:flagellar export chaperone FlgN [Propionispora hippei]SHI54876.1 FlgN protein [Propionispora hippei DSM 15287]